MNLRLVAMATLLAVGVVALGGAVETLDVAPTAAAVECGIVVHDPVIGGWTDPCKTVCRVLKTDCIL